MIAMNAFDRFWDDTGRQALDALERVGRSGWYVLGEEVAAFEAETAPLFGHRHGVGCANGLDAIEIALRALGLQLGDRVLTTPMSAFATTLAILRAGGKPVFADVDERGLIDLSLAEKALRADRSIRFMVPVHLYGHSLDLERLKSLKERFGLKLVEDCAQSIGASFNGKAAGSIGQIATTSFYPTKNLGCLGDGGALYVSDEALLKTAKAIRDYGQDSKYSHAMLGLNSRLDETHASMLRRAFLPKLASWTENRERIARKYLQGLTHPGARPFGAIQGSRSVWHLFPLRVPKGRENLMQHLKAANIQSGIHYPLSIHRQKALEEMGPFGDFPNSDRLANEELSLPIHPYLRDAEVDAVIAAVNTWEG